MPNIPEQDAASDQELNRAIRLREFRQAALDCFQLLDKRHEGRLMLQELEALKPVIPSDGKFPKHRDKDLDTRVGVPLPPGGRESN